MAHRRSKLGERVRRLLDVDSERGSAHPMAGLLAALVPLCLVGLLAPGVMGTLDRHPADAIDGPRPMESVPTALQALDRDIAGLDREIREVQVLLEEAGHSELAGRLDDRRQRVAGERVRLGERIESGEDE